MGDVYFIVLDISSVVNRNSAFSCVLPYQNSFSGSKFVVIWGSFCQDVRGNALVHKVLRLFTKNFVIIVISQPTTRYSPAYGTMRVIE